MTKSICFYSCSASADILKSINITLSSHFRYLVLPCQLTGVLQGQWIAHLHSQNRAFVRFSNRSRYSNRVCTGLYYFIILFTGSGCGVCEGGGGEAWHFASRYCGLFYACAEPSRATDNILISLYACECSISKLQPFASPSSLRRLTNTSLSL